MAIVIPVAVEGVRIANRAGLVSERKAMATRVAERVLNEWVITGGTMGAANRGVIQEEALEFRYQIQIAPWTEDAMQMATVHVIYDVQGREYEVNLSTLVEGSF